MKKSLITLFLSAVFFIVPLFAMEQVNIRFNKENTMCVVVSKQKVLDTSKCDSIVVYPNYIYCILKNK